MILKQYYLACLSQASYLIADEETGVAAVVDPRRDVEPYLDEAEASGLRIEHVILTHFHADFLAGHLELRARTGARIHLGARAEAEYEFSPLAEGQTLELGSVRLRILETPGHTPEGISIVVHDSRSDPEKPYAVLTGDTLFIGDVGRPDLMASVGMTAEELASMMYDSLHEKLLKLPDETLVYPGHGAGSACGKNLSADTVSTIGAQRSGNYALQPMTKAEFVSLITAHQPVAPAYFPYDATLNKSEHATLDSVLEAAVKPLSLDELLRAQNSGAQVLDVRDAESFAAGHLAGSIHVGLEGRFASWCGTLLEPGQPIAIIAEAGAEAEAALRLGRIGFDALVGFLEGGPAAFASRPELVRRHQRLTPDELRRVLKGERPPLVVDVRTPGEREASAIEGSVHVPLTSRFRPEHGLPRDRDLVLVCKTGYRSSSAASLLFSAGYERVADLEGGMDAWLGETCAT